jgi:hypothetical protein
MYFESSDFTLTFKWLLKAMHDIDSVIVGFLYEYSGTVAGAEQCA